MQTSLFLLNDQIKSKLQEVSDFLENENHWTKINMAKTKDFIAVQVFSEKAHCFCLAGAIIRLCAGNAALGWMIRNYLSGRLPNGFTTIGRFNDSVSHEELLGFLKESIENL